MSETEEWYGKSVLICGSVELKDEQERKEMEENVYFKTTVKAINEYHRIQKLKNDEPKRRGSQKMNRLGNNTTKNT